MALYLVIAETEVEQLVLGADGSVQKQVLPIGTVLNRVLWDGESPWEAPPNTRVELVEQADG